MSPSNNKARADEATVEAAEAKSGVVFEAARAVFGEVAEWSNVPDSKSGVR
jgi:hypothetical protein